MSNVRKFRVIGGGKSEAESDITAQIKKHKWKTVIRKILLVTLAVFVVGMVITKVKNQVFVSATISKKIDHKLVENTNYLENGQCYIIYSKDGISSMDSEGKVIWNLTYEMQNPIVRTSQAYVAVGDYNGHIIYLIDKKGTIYEIDTGLPIREFTVSKEGLVASVLEDNGNSWVNLFDKTGEKIVEAKATMSRTGYPVAVALSGEVMGVSYFYIDDSMMRSSVTFYNFGGVGENVTDHIVSSYDYADSVVPIVALLGEDKFFAVGDNRIMFFEGEKKPVSCADILLQEEIQSVYYGDHYVGLVFYDQTGEFKYRLDVYNETGKKQFSRGFDMDFKDVLIANNQVMIYNDSRFKIYDVKGKEKYDGTFNEKVSYVLKTETGRKYMLVTNNSMEVLEFN